MQHSSEELFIDLDGSQIALKKWGSSNGTPILALHGWLDNAGTFDLLAPHLKDFQLFAIDLPGHGHSSHWPRGISYHSIDGVGTLSQMIDYFSWNKVILLGHSMGASIGSLFAGTFPEKVEKLILLEGLGPLNSNPDEAPSRLRRSILQYAELPKKQLPVYETIERAIEVRRQASQMTVEAVTPIVSRGLKKVPGGFTWRTDPRLKMESPYRMTEPQILAFLSQIVCPVLWIQAKKGLKWDPTMIANRAAALKNLQTFELEGGHHFHLESPKAIADLILEFL